MITIWLFELNVLFHALPNSNRLFFLSEAELNPACRMNRPRAQVKHLICHLKWSAQVPDSILKHTRAYRDGSRIGSARSHAGRLKEDATGQRTLPEPVFRSSVRTWCWTRVWWSVETFGSLLFWVWSIKVTRSLAWRPEFVCVKLSGRDANVQTFTFPWPLTHILSAPSFSAHFFFYIAICWPEHIHLLMGFVV